MSKPCPFCGASDSGLLGAYSLWTCGTRTGAKGHPSLYWRGKHCREWTKIMTPPPSNEAVEAAKKSASQCGLSYQACLGIFLTPGYWHTKNERLQAAARILAAALEAKEREVEELRMAAFAQKRPF